MSTDLAIFVLGLVVSLVTGAGLLSFYRALSQGEAAEAAETAVRSPLRPPLGGVR